MYRARPREGCRQDRKRFIHPIRCTHQSSALLLVAWAAVGPRVVFHGGSHLPALHGLTQLTAGHCGSCAPATTLFRVVMPLVASQPLVPFPSAASPPLPNTHAEKAGWWEAAAWAAATICSVVPYWSASVRGCASAKGVMKRLAWDLKGCDPERCCCQQAAQVLPRRQGQVYWSAVDPYHCCGRAGVDLLHGDVGV